MREHKSAIEKQMAEKNENSKRDIVCEVRRRRRVLAREELPGVGGG